VWCRRRNQKVTIMASPEFGFFSALCDRFSSRHSSFRCVTLMGLTTKSLLYFQAGPFGTLTDVEGELIHSILGLIRIEFYITLLGNLTR